MKYEWRKHDKKIYLPKENPEIIELGPVKYITICGKGNPNAPAFSELVTAYTLLLTRLKCCLKKG